MRIKSCKSPQEAAIHSFIPLVLQNIVSKVNALNYQDSAEICYNSEVWYIFVKIFVEIL